MQPNLVSRRDIFKLLAAASAAGAMLPPHLDAQPKTLARGDLWDPDFLKKNIPWDKPLVDTELATLTVLCDLIIPGDDDAPPPSKIGVADFLNEWIGAPYPQNIADREILRGGLGWLDTHSQSLHSAPFRELEPAQQTAILDSICGASEIPPALAYGHAFFRKLRSLTLGGYYTHSSSWKSLGYIGNMPMGGAYPGVPDEITKRLGLEGL
jgi:hypothetical protein